MKIKNITLLRDHALETLEKLASGKIDVDEAGVTGKLCESVMSTIKSQLEYAKMLNREPNIPFLGDLSKQPRLIEMTPEKEKKLLK